MKIYGCHASPKHEVFYTTKRDALAVARAASLDTTRKRSEVTVQEYFVGFVNTEIAVGMLNGAHWCHEFRETITVEDGRITERLKAHRKAV